MIVCLILHLEEERMFVGKNIVEGNNKKRKKAQKVAKLVSTNHKQQQRIFTQKEKNLLMFVVMFIKVLINYWSITKKYVVEK